MNAASSGTSELPLGWTRVRLGDVGFAYSGLSGKTKENFGSGSYYVPYKNVFLNTFIDASYLDRVEVAIDESQNKVELGDVLLTVSSETPEEVGMSTVVDKLIDGNLYLNSFCFGFRPVKKCFDVIYSGYAFRSDLMRKKLIYLAQGSTRFNISKGRVLEIDLPIPPLDEQRKIGAILTAVDDKLNVITRQIAATQTLKQGLMQTLFTRGVGTQDATGRWVPHAEFKESSLGAIPASWQATEIQSIATVIRGASPRPQGDPRYYGGAVPRLMGADVTRDGKWVTPRIDFLTEEGAKLSRPCPKGTLTIICSGDVGIPAFLAVDACIHDGFLALIDINESLVNKDFLYHIIFSLKQRLDASATHGGVFTNLTTGILKEFAIPLPPLAEQNRIATILSSIDEKLDALASRKTHCKTIKRGLMQKLLTGEWRVQLSP